MPHLSTHHRGRSPSSNGFSTSNGGGDLGIIYNVKRSDGGRSLPRPARKTYNQHKSAGGGVGGLQGTTSNNQQWRSRSSEATNGGRTLMSRSVTHYAASTVASRSHQQLYPRQQAAATSRSLSRSHEERALRSVSSSTSAVPTASSGSHHHVSGGSQRQSLTSITTLAASKNSLNQQQMLPAVVPPPPSYGNGSTNPVIHSSLSNSITSSTTSGSKNALAASITQQVRHFSIFIDIFSCLFTLGFQVSFFNYSIKGLSTLEGVRIKSSLKRLGLKVLFLMNGAAKSTEFISSFSRPQMRLLLATIPIIY